ncbi:PREDICTED: glycerol-3-phosphate dehydrogenase [NAD(+)], cytoplasmic-like isoform X2 [Acropora digitifera]|uniref:glycerol-3-phosphate dehydrogenase [NAD(+)], cytoplasmic-like isoform X2 n=1 Tax=Acropora digitifera TaxID=70779 RepID=UPI00077A4C05|nr:PREDICTED: glycerol-3-phosphate dehydrogenase [NAD(+)], cytoplasmic-like isoform X2 [Acropora digitifera]
MSLSHFVRGLHKLAMASPRKIAIIGSGNWGSVIARIIGANVKDHPDSFHNQVQMYVYEELIDGKKLTEIINSEHENVKYLKGHKLPENIKANPDVVEAAKDADILVFVLPHQFVKNVCRKLKDSIKPSVIAVSLIKGLDHASVGLNLVSNIIKDELNIPDVSVLMGANLAKEVAREMFGEATIGCRTEEHGPILKELFHTEYFKINVVKDADTVELCGSLKNAVAVGAGVVDALGYGDNSKAAVIRIGLKEMIQFAKQFYDNVELETFFESCGVADLITTCYGGRNRIAGEEFVKGKTFEEVEQYILGGQKLQGPHTVYEVYHLLKENNLLDEYPLLTAIYNVCFEKHPPSEMIEVLKRHL